MDLTRREITFLSDSIGFYLTASAAAAAAARSDVITDKAAAVLGLRRSKKYIGICRKISQSDQFA